MRALILTTDVIFGMFVAIAIIAVTLSFVNSSYESGIGDLSMKRIASDIIAVLDYNGTLDTLNAASIESGINHLLPKGMEMGVNITVYNASFSRTGSVAINYGGGGRRYGGRWGFAGFSGMKADKFAAVDYWIGFREAG